MCFAVGGVVFTGDTLFPGGPGKTSGGDDFDEIIANIEDHLFVLDDSTIVMPGHGRDTTIGQERPQLEGWIARRW
jgi:glyoxylase-like metal-dependent hydrolase (beta-lactamase superfamily II)